MVDPLEHGDVQFFFRPTVQPAEAEQFTLGVQSFFLILSPAGRPYSHRRVRIGKKRMPANPRERFWARVERVGTLQRVLADELEAQRYTTKTRGERYAPGARLIAHGTYELVRHDEHVHFAYRLEGQGFEEAPDEIEVPEAGNHLVLFERIQPGRGIWTPNGSIDQLDDDGAELVLVGPSQSGDHDYDRELAIVN